MVDLTRDRFAEIRRPEGAVGVAKRGEPPQVGLERNLQNGVDDAIIQGNPAGSLVTPKEAKRADFRVVLDACVLFSCRASPGCTGGSFFLLLAMFRFL